jgi:hypothetical protein
LNRVLAGAPLLYFGVPSVAKKGVVMISIIELKENGFASLKLTPETALEKEYFKRIRPGSSEEVQSVNGQRKVRLLFFGIEH